MDATITYDEFAAFVGINVPMLEPHPNFERIHALHRQLERCLQRLPCPQSVQHGWKGMVMARELYSLLTNVPIHLPTNPGAAAIYVHARVTGQPVDKPHCRGRNRRRLTPYSIAASTIFFRCRTLNARVLRPLTQASTMPSRYRTIQTFEDDMQG